MKWRKPLLSFLFLLLFFTFLFGLFLVLQNKRIHVSDDTQYGFDLNRKDNFNLVYNQLLLLYENNQYQSVVDRIDRELAQAELNDNARKKLYLLEISSLKKLGLYNQALSSLNKLQDTLPNEGLFLQATIEDELGQYEKMEASLLRDIELNQSHYSREKLADFYFLRNRYSDAYPLYFKGPKQKQPLNLDARLKIALCELLMNQKEKALNNLKIFQKLEFNYRYLSLAKLLESLLSDNPVDKEVYYQQAIRSAPLELRTAIKKIYAFEMIKSNRLDEAWLILLEVEKKDQASHKVYESLGFLAMNKQRYSQAAEHYRRSIAGNPARQNLYNTAIAYYLSEQDQKALEYLNATLAKSALYDDVTESALLLLNEITRKSDSQRSFNILSKAINEWGKQEPLMLALAKTHISVNPDQFLLWLNNNPELENNPDIIFEKIKIFQSRGEYENAMSLLEQLLSQHPDTLTHFHFWSLGNIQLQLRLFSEAQNTFQEVLANRNIEDEARGAISNNLLYALYKNGYAESLKNGLSRRIETQHVSPVAHYNLARVAKKNDNTVAYDRHLKEAWKQKDSYQETDFLAYLHLEMGLYHMENGRNGAAKTYFKEAIILNPNNPVIRFYSHHL